MRIAVPFVLFFTLLGTTVASAHSLGASFEREVNGLIVDIGYEPAEMLSGEYVRFDFELWRSASERVPQDYVYVWVRLLQERQTLLASGIHRQEIGPTTLLYIFQEAGKYQLEASYRDAEGNDIARASFPITVERAPRTVSPLLLCAGVLAAGVAVGIAALVIRRRV